MIEGLHYVSAKRPGKPTRWYVYAYRGGPKIMTAMGPVKPRLTREALDAYQAAMVDERAVKADTLEGLARDWRSPDPSQRPHSPEWKKLAVTTQATWGRELDIITDRWGSTPLAVWNDPRMVAKVIAWRDSRADTPRSADIGVTVLAELLKFGRLRARVLTNVAEGVPAIYEGADRAEIVWTAEDMAAFKATKQARETVADILDLACLTGFRRADLCDVTFAEVSPQAIIRIAQKKSRGQRRRAVIPLLGETVELIERLRSRYRKPGVDTLLVNSFGEAWKPASMTLAFNTARDAANPVDPSKSDPAPKPRGIVHAGSERLGMPDRKKHLHDCRGTFVTKLCRTDLSNNEIARIVAWSPENVERIRRTYVDDAAVVVALSERMGKMR